MKLLECCQCFIFIFSHIIFSFLGLKITSSVFFTLRLSFFALNQFERFDKSLFTCFSLFSLNQFERFDKPLFTCFDNLSSDRLDCIILVSSGKWYSGISIKWAPFIPKKSARFMEMSALYNVSLKLNYFQKYKDTTNIDILK